MTAAPATGWLRRIVELVSKGDFQEALVIYKHLLFLLQRKHSESTTRKEEGSYVDDDDDDPRTSTFLLPSVLKACACSTSSSPHHLLLLAAQIHAATVKNSICFSHLPTANSLLFAYAKRSGVHSARTLFDEMTKRDVVTWSSLIVAYIREGFLSEPLDVFRQMRACGLLPRPELVAMVISACGRMGMSEIGRQIHGMSICVGGVLHSVHVSTALLDMYSRCMNYSAALKVFRLMPERNVVSWTAMINGCLTNRDHHLCLRLFAEMFMDEGVTPNRATLLAALTACRDLGAFEEGRQIHGYVFRHGFNSEPMVSAALIDMYSRRDARAIELALPVFDGTTDARRDVTIWTAIISCCAKSGDHVRALELFHRMQAEGNVRPNSITMLALVDVCLSLSSHDLALAIHAITVTSGLISDVVLMNSLIGMYAGMGYLDCSVQAFAEMPTRDVVSWTSMISAYGLHGRGHEALSLYDKMLSLDSTTIQPDAITLLAVLSACNHSGLVEDGKRIFDHATRNRGIHLNLQHYACYLHLLGRSGRIGDAYKVLRGMPMKPNSRILTSLVSACKYHGRFETAQILGNQLIGDEPLNGASYTLLSMAHAECGNWREVEEVARTMRERKVKKGRGCSWIAAK